MAERRGADIEVAPLCRALLDGVDDPTGAARQRVDLAVLPCFEDERPLQGLAGLVDWRMGGHLSALIRTGLCTGSMGEQVLLPGRRTLPMERLVLLGLGASDAFDRARAEAVGEGLVILVERLAPRDVLVAMPGRVPDRAMVEAVFDGLIRTLRERDPGPDDAVARPAVRVVGDDSSPVLVEALPGDDSPQDEGPRAEDGVVALPGAAMPRAVDASIAAERTMSVASPGAAPRPGPGAEDPGARGDGPGSSGVRPGARRWWVVADPRHEARLRRLLEGPPRAAEQGA
jgi:hypothetical protein